MRSIFSSLFIFLLFSPHSFSSLPYPLLPISAFLSCSPLVYSSYLYFSTFILSCLFHFSPIISPLLSSSYLSSLSTPSSYTPSLSPLRPSVTPFATQSSYYYTPSLSTAPLPPSARLTPPPLPAFTNTTVVVLARHNEQPWAVWKRRGGRTGARRGEGRRGWCRLMLSNHIYPTSRRARPGSRPLGLILPLLLLFFLLLLLLLHLFLFLLLLFVLFLLLFLRPRFYSFSVFFVFFFSFFSVSVHSSFL